jgi:hypothetical protein
MFDPQIPRRAGALIFHNPRGGADIDELSIGVSEGFTLFLFLPLRSPKGPTDRTVVEFDEFRSDQRSS